MNTINSNKLLHSTWTAAQPERREKHFMVTQLLLDEAECVVYVVLEAVLTRREFTLAWRELKNDETWRMGWQ